MTKKRRDRAKISLVPPPFFSYNQEKRREGDCMFRLWAKLWKDNRMLKDTVICNDADDTRTHKVFDAIHQICLQFDLSEPIWLESNIQDFRRHAKTRFTQNSFVESVDFDHLEIQIIEED